MLKEKLSEEEKIERVLETEIEKAKNKEIDAVIEMGNWNFTCVPTDGGGIPLNDFPIDFAQEKYINEYIISGNEPLLWTDVVKLSSVFVSHLQVFFATQKYDYEQQKQFLDDHDLFWIDGDGLYATLKDPVYYIQVPN